MSDSTNPDSEGENRFTSNSTSPSQTARIDFNTLQDVPETARHLTMWSLIGAKQLTKNLNPGKLKLGIDQLCGP